MITRENYLEKMKTVDLKSLPENVMVAKEFFDEATNNGMDYSAADSESEIAEAIDLYFKAIDAITKKSVKKKTSVPSTKPKAPSKPKRTSTTGKGKTRSSKAVTKKQSTVKAEKVEKLSPEIKFMKRFMRLHDKKKTRKQIRIFINALQKAIKERQIRKTSEYAKEIMEIQKSLIDFHKRYKNAQQEELVAFTDKTRNKYNRIIQKEVEYYSVRFIKAYINLQGKIIPNQKAQNLFKRINNALKRGVLDKRDKYWNEIESILNQLETFIEKNPEEGMLKIESRELNGLNGIVNKCGCVKTQSLSGISKVPENTILNSMDVLKIKHKKLGLTGKWLKFIGDATRGFKAMVYGRPKMGKSYLSVGFAGYLARKIGKVLYVAREEGFDETFRIKLKELGAAHPNLDISDFLPEDLSGYDFVFLDSVSRLGLNPNDLEGLEKQYPEISFLYVHQVTKKGISRGSNEHLHNVDVIIEVPEKGYAIQNGRFNQGSEMEIFDNLAA